MAWPQLGGWALRRLCDKRVIGRTRRLWAGAVIGWLANGGVMGRHS